MSTIEEPESISEEPEMKTHFKIESLDDLKRFITVAKGGDPDAIQAIANFMDLKSNIERSYFPNKVTTLCIGQLVGLGKVYFPSDEWNPFSLVADCLSIAYMPYKGFKSNQFVDMTRQTPSLADIKTVAEQEQQGGILSRILNRGPKND